MVLPNILYYPIQLWIVDIFSLNVSTEYCLENENLTKIYLCHTLQQKKLFPIVL